MFFNVKGEWYYACKKPTLEVYETARNDAGGTVYYNAFWKEVENVPSSFPEEVREKCTFWEIEIESSQNGYGCCIPVTVCDCESPLQPCF